MESVSVGAAAIVAEASESRNSFDADRVERHGGEARESFSRTALQWTSVEVLPDFAAVPATGTKKQGQVLDLTLLDENGLAATGRSHQVEGAGALDLAGDAAVQLGRDAGGAAGVDLAGFGGEVLEELGIEVVHLLRRDVEAAAGHAPVGAAKVDGSLFGFWTHGVSEMDGWCGSALLAMESATLQVGIELHFLQAARSAEALFVARGHVDGRTCAFRLGLGAFKNDDFSGHGWKEWMVSRGRGI